MMVNFVNLSNKSALNPTVCAYHQKDGSTVRIIKEAFSENILQSDLLVSLLDNKNSVEYTFSHHQLYVEGSINAVSTP